MSKPSAPLADLADLVEALLEDADRACGTYADDPSTWHARHREAMADVAARLAIEHDAKIDDSKPWVGVKVRISGVTASGTSGTAAALRNWVAAARRKVEA